VLGSSWRFFHGTDRRERRERSHSTIRNRKPTRTATGFLPPSRDVVTYHYNAFRRGLTKVERILTPSNVNSSTLGKVNFFSVDGKVDAQPRYANKVPANSRAHDLLLVVTEHDNIYAFDAASGANLEGASVAAQ